MTIKEAKELTGLSIKSIRYYEKMGLVNIRRNKNNYYRDYTKEDIEILKLIKVLRYIDFSIEQIALILQENNLSDALKMKSKELEIESNKYLEKQTICNSLLKDNKKKELHMVIDEYIDTIDLLETNEAKEIKNLFMDFLCPSLSAIIIQSFIYVAPIIWLFINIYDRNLDALILNSIAAIICTSLLVGEWIYYFSFKSKHKEITKKRNKNNSLIIPILIISIIFVIILFILLNIALEYFMAPKDYLFFETSTIFTKLMIYAIVILLLIVIGMILKKLKINRSEDLEIYIDLWQRFKGIWIVLFVIISYCFLTSVTFVTENKIIYRDPLHPFGLFYDYDDVTKIETGFGNKNFSLVEYKRKGQFYYRIYIDDKKVTFSVPSVNEKIERYENDSYLELEEFDNKLMKYNIKKITDSEYAKACDLDKEFYDRFMRIINND